MSTLNAIPIDALPNGGPLGCTALSLPVNSTIVIKRNIPGSAVEATFLVQFTGIARGRVTGVVKGIVCTRETQWKAGKAKQAGIYTGSAMSAQPSATGVVVNGRIQWLSEQPCAGKSVAGTPT